LGKVGVEMNVIKHKPVGSGLSQTEWEADDSHIWISGISNPASPSLGDTFFNYSDNALYFYDDNEWQPIGTSWRRKEIFDITSGASNLTVTGIKSLYDIKKYDTLVVASGGHLKLYGWGRFLGSSYWVNGRNVAGIAARNFYISSGGILSMLNVGGFHSGGIDDGGGGGAGGIFAAINFKNEGKIIATGYNGESLDNPAGSEFSKDQSSGVQLMFVSGYRIGIGGAGGGTKHIGGGGSADGAPVETPIYVDEKTMDREALNVLRTNYGTAPVSYGYYHIRGGAGGSGRYYDGDWTYAGGGGSGGYLVFSVINWDCLGEIDVRGGNGGDAEDSGQTAYGGGGGGGGAVYVFYENLINSGTIHISGGAGGSGTDVHGSDGGIGSRLFYKMV